jgi:hypothetical protein
VYVNISRKVATAALLIGTSVLFTTAHTAHAGEKLSAGEIAALFPGKFEAIWRDRHQVHVVASRDGEVRGSYGIFSGSGEWAIVGDELCVTINLWSRAKPRCSEVIRHGNWYVGMINRKGKARVRFRPQ